VGGLTISGRLILSFPGFTGLPAVNTCGDFVGPLSIFVAPLGYAVSGIDCQPSGQRFGKE